MNSVGRRGAFTLIELLVVIAVIAILAALLLPVLASAKLRSQRIKCIANLKQMTAASFMYWSDYSLMWPYYMNGKTGTYQLWTVTLQNYHAKANPIRICPSAPETARTTDATIWGTADSAWSWADVLPTQRGSYGFNGWLYSTDDPFHNTPGDATKRIRHESDIRAPSRTPVFVDCIFVDTWPETNDPPSRDLYNGEKSLDIGKIGRITISRHGSRAPGSAPRSWPSGQKLPGGVNLACADGHAELAQLEQLWDYMWYRGYQPPSPRPP